MHVARYRVAVDSIIVEWSSEKEEIQQNTVFLLFLFPVCVIMCKSDKFLHFTTENGLEKRMFWWIVSTLCAFFVKGLCGFANTLVFSTILSFGNNNINISPIELLLGYPGNIILAWKEKMKIKWHLCVPLAGLVLLGNIPGIFLLKNADTGMIKLIFGFAIILIGMEMLFREMMSGKNGAGQSEEKGSKIVLAIIGVLSGILCGLYGIGALLGAYIGRVTKDTASFKANICIVFVVENTFRMVMYLTLGIITYEAAMQALLMVPFMLLGLAAGMLSGRFLSERIVKKLVIVLLILSGVALIINHVG